MRFGGESIMSLVCGGILALLLGFTLVEEQIVGFALLAVLLVTLTLTRAGLLSITGAVIIALPWLVMVNALLPRLTITIAATAAVLCLLLLARDIRFPDVASLGPPLFLAVVLVNAIQAQSSEQLTEAAKYLIFPCAVIAVTNPRVVRQLGRLRSALLYGGIAAMVAQIGIIALHLGNAGSKYGVGEQLGLTAPNPHEFSLAGTTIAVACLVSIKNLRWRFACAAIALLPALATGVRSTLIGAGVAIIIVMIRARMRTGVVLSVAALCALVVVSGVSGIIANRFAEDQAAGEYSSLSAAGSGRGQLWSTVTSAWFADGPRAILFGDGLQSVQHIQEAAFFKRAFVAQSDPVAMVVEFGLIGLGTWILMWISLLRARVEWVILIPLMAFAVFNGAIGYVGATLFAVALSVACMSNTAITENTRRFSMNGRNSRARVGAVHTVTRDASMPPIGQQQMSQAVDRATP
jgi:hypothetical protein